MRAIAAIALLTAVPSIGPATTPVVTVEMSNFKFAPTDIQLRAGVPVVLHLTNAAKGGHNFSAPEFFAAAKLDPQSAALVRGGKIEVPSKGSVDIALTPAAGEYSLKCTHTLHSSFGMKGRITVQR
jgi:uncharacterized cupredoxin-like copper-binding protein